MALEITAGLHNHTSYVIGPGMKKTIIIDFTMFILTSLEMELGYFELESFTGKEP